MEEDEIALPTSKIRGLKSAIDGLEGIPIPYNIIIHQLVPLRCWCMQVLGDD